MLLLDWCEEKMFKKHSTSCGSLQKKLLSQFTKLFCLRRVMLKPMMVKNVKIFVSKQLSLIKVQ
ncbi:UNVERIFIED_CONTAM: hypothetical protein GTU68_023574 [Idotea baltica]|nr:hypothetical protein [Idotea baltica]